MKDYTKIKNYRTKYKRYFGIDFDQNFDIHHINFDRSDNEIKNLLLLPKELHAKYHFILNAIGATNGNADLTLNNLNVTEYNSLIFEQLPAVLAECRKWQKLKEYRYSEVAYKTIFAG